MGDALLALTPLPPSPSLGEGGMLFALRCASGAGAPQRQILAPSPGRGGGRGWGMRGLGAQLPKTLYLRANPVWGLPQRHCLLQLRWTTML